MVRSVSLDISAGCDACLLPAPGKFNPDRAPPWIICSSRRAMPDYACSFRWRAAALPARRNPIRCAIRACIFARWHKLPPAAFFTDPGVRADFAAAVTALLDHLNGETNIAYRNDPVVAAWENCDGCGVGIDPAVLADWTEFLGRTIKTAERGIFTKTAPLPDGWPPSAPGALPCPAWI